MGVFGGRVLALTERVSIVSCSGSFGFSVANATSTCSRILADGKASTETFGYGQGRCVAAELANRKTTSSCTSTFIAPSPPPRRTDPIPP